MKKVMLLAMSVFMAAGIASAQNYMVVNTETIFKSLDAYNTAVKEIDEAASRYQKSIDNAYQQLEEMYTEYMAEKATLTQAAQREREQTILNNEQKIAQYQENAFGTDGSISKMQTEKLEPLQKKVIETIGSYAAAHGYGLVIDIATNPIVVYYSPSVDKTQDIITLLK